MKAFFCLLYVIPMLLLPLSGCGEKEQTPPAPSSSAQEPAASSRPQTAEEILENNQKIDPAQVDLIQFQSPGEDAVTVTIHTTLGEIRAVLYPSEAPKAVENFLQLAEDGFYDGCVFYETTPGRRICSGSLDPAGKTGKSSLDGGAPFEDEYSLNLWHFNGALAMDNSGVPGANDSRFYIIQNDNISTELATQMLEGGFPDKVVQKYLDEGGVPNYDFRDTVFGQVIEGMQVVEQIAGQQKTGEDGASILLVQVE